MEYVELVLIYYAIIKCHQAFGGEEGVKYRLLY